MTKTQELLTPQNLLLLHQMFDTSRIEDGILVWKERPKSHFKKEQHQRSFNRQWAGKQVGRRVTQADPRVFVRITLPNRGNTLVLMHRLIWLLYFGETPPKMIDHINRISWDNRPSNLRATTPKQNSENSYSHSSCLSSGAISETTDGHYRLDFQPPEGKPWELEFDSLLLAETALNYLSFLYDDKWLLKADISN